MRDSNVGKVRIDSLYNLVVVVRKFLELEIKIIQTSDELLGEDSFNNKPAAVMLKSGFAEQLVEADALRLVKPEGVFITRSWGDVVFFLGRYS